jgi:protein O-GlcNAc transferase
LTPAELNRQLDGRFRLQAAQQLLAGGRIEQAEQQLRQELAHAEQRGEALYLLAVAAVLGSRPAEALQLARDAVAERPEDARCHFALGRAHKLAGQLQAAISAYRQAIALAPEYAEAHVSLGIALKHGGDLAAAITSYEHAIALNPGFAVARANLAYARAAQIERQTEAGTEDGIDEGLLAAAQEAVAQEPGQAPLHFNLGLLLRRAQRRADAIDAFNRALGLAPSDLGYCLHLGHELTSSGATRSAAVLYERWMEVNPPNPSVMRALAFLLTREGSAGEALRWSERAASLDPDPGTWLQLCNAYQQCRRLDDALVAGRRAIALSGGQWQNYSIPLMVANYQLEDAQAIADLHAEFGQSLAQALFAGGTDRRRRPARRTRQAAEKLRVGYVSADFINHSVGFFIGALLERHDRSRFEVTCYHNRGWGDSMTEKLQLLGHHWVECEHLGDEALARRIAADGIDILIDLAGHTAGGRVALFGGGAAPVQIAYLGYPTASGIPLIDHRISDFVVDAGDMPDIGSERPLRLPRSMFCYRPPERPAITPPPQWIKGHLTLGSFNNHAKLSDHTLDLWAQILRALPGARLLLKSASVADKVNRDDIEAFMAARGVSADRLELRTRIEARESHFDAYNEVDIALDPYPYNGATTTCEALWMGVPVVSRCGPTHTSRMGASILQAAGKPEWIVHDDAGYVALAVALAADAPQRAHWRLQAREYLAASELMDEAGFANCFEQALEAAWAASEIAGSA